MWTYAKAAIEECAACLCRCTAVQTAERHYLLARLVEQPHLCQAHRLQTDKQASKQASEQVLP